MFPSGIHDRKVVPIQSSEFSFCKFLVDNEHLNSRLYIHIVVCPYYHKAQF